MPINSLPVRQEVASETLRVLYNNCPALRMVSREYQKYFEQSTPIGTTLQIPRPWRPQGRQGQGFQPEPVVQTTVPLTISYWRGGDFIYNDTDENLFFDMSRFHKKYSGPMGVMIANQVEADLEQFIQATSPNFVGTPGTLPTSTSTYNGARTSLNKLLAPDQNRAIIWPSEFEQNLVGLSQTLFQPDQTKPYLEGVIGKYAGFTFARSEQIPGITVGTYAGIGLVNGASQTGSSLITDGWTAASLSLTTTDKFTIAGCFKVNPSGTHNVYSGSQNLMQFAVTQAVTDSTGAATIQIYPPIISSGQFQNCTAPADNAIITIAGASGATANTALFMQEEAYTSAFLKLHKPSNVECTIVGGDEMGTPGIFLRNIKQWQSSGPYAGYETDRSDVIYGFGATYADLFAGVVYG